MRRFNNVSFVMILMAFMISTVSCKQEAAPQAKVTQEELSASVPELSEMHDVVYPLWHTAFPDKDFALIKELLPQMDALMQKLDEAELPGILRERHLKRLWNSFIRRRMEITRKKCSTRQKPFILPTNFWCGQSGL